MDMEVIKRKPVIIGVALIIALYIISDMMSGVSLLLPSFLLAGIAVGFMINGDMKVGAINGAVMGLIGSIIINIILIAVIYSQGYGDYIVSIVLTYLIYIVIEIIVGTVGGVLGTLIKAESVQNRELDSPEN